MNIFKVYQKLLSTYYYYKLPRAPPVQSNKKLPIYALVQDLYRILQSSFHVPHPSPILFHYRKAVVQNT